MTPRFCAVGDVPIHSSFYFPKSLGNEFVIDDTMAYTDLKTSVGLHYTDHIKLQVLNEMRFTVVE